MPDSPTIEQYLFRIQCDPNASNDPTSTAFFGEKTTVGDKVFKDDLASSVSWRLLADTEVTVGELTLTYAQVSAFVTAIAYQEKAAADAGK